MTAPRPKWQAQIRQASSCERFINVPIMRFTFLALMATGLLAGAGKPTTKIIEETAHRWASSSKNLG